MSIGTMAPDPSVRDYADTSPASLGRSTIQHDHWKPSITKCWPVMKQGSQVARKATS